MSGGKEVQSYRVFQKERQEEKKFHYTGWSRKSGRRKKRSIIQGDPERVLGGKIIPFKEKLNL